MLRRSFESSTDTEKRLPLIDKTPIAVLTTGGTIDKVYFDAKSSYEIGDSPIPELLDGSNLSLALEIRTLMRKDSLDMTDDDRRAVRAAVLECDRTRIVITHGTDTMVDTARVLMDVPGKTIVLTGAMQPARFRATDALYNLASALTAAQVLPPGVYIAMNGRIFDPARTRKNREMNCFEEI